MKIWSKLKTKILTLGVALLLITAPCFAFDKNLSEEAKAKFETRLVKHDAYYTFVTVNAQGTAEALYPKSVSPRFDGDTYIPSSWEWKRAEAYWSQIGSGTVVQPGWILTAAHVVEPEYVEIIMSPTTTFVTKPVKVNSTTILIRDYKGTPQIAWVHYIDRDRDVALLRYVPQGFLEPLDIKQSVDGFLLEAGDQLAIVVHERDELGKLDYRVKMKWGTVVKPGPTSPHEHTTAWLSPTDFTMDIPLIGGDSGSLVFAFENGKPVFIGIARAMYGDGIVFCSYAAWIGDIIARLLSIG